MSAKRNSWHLSIVYGLLGAFLFWSLLLLLVPIRQIFIGWVIATLLIGLALTLDAFLLGVKTVFNLPEDEQNKIYSDGDSGWRPLIIKPEGHRFVRAKFSVASTVPADFKLNRGEVIKPSRLRRFWHWLRRLPPPEAIVTEPSIEFAAPPPAGTAFVGVYSTEWTEPSPPRVRTTQKIVTVFEWRCNGGLWHYDDTLIPIYDWIENGESGRDGRPPTIEVRRLVMTEQEYQEKKHAAY